MSAYVFLSGLLLFLACLCVHIILWHMRYPRNRAGALFIIFFFIPVLAAALSFILVKQGILTYSLSFKSAEWLAAFLLHFALSSAYIMTYPAVEAVSPSLVLVLLIGESGGGLTHKDLAGVFADDILLNPRINDLRDMNLIGESGGGLCLTLKGRLLIHFFVLYRSFIGLPVGRG